MIESDSRSHTHDPQAAAPGNLERVRQFINTLDIEAKTDAFGTMEDAQIWLIEYDFLSPKATITNQGLQHICAVREALRNLTLANNHAELDPNALVVLNRAAQEAPLIMSLFSHTDAQLQPIKENVEGAIGAVFAFIYDAMKEGTWSRLKACLNDACQWTFYDSSKNHSGKWCSMAVCGSRMKVRAYRARQADADS